MMWRVLIVVVALSAGGSAAAADYEGRIIGDWITSGQADRFGDGGTYVALTVNKGIMLAVRCIRRTLSIGVLDASVDPKPLKEGQEFTFKFRVDKLPIVEAVGIAIDPRLIQIVGRYPELVRDMRDGRETAMKMDGGMYSTVNVFRMRGARRAFADIEKECPLPKGGGKGGKGTSGK